MHLTKEQWTNQVIAERNNQKWTYEAGGHTFDAYVSRIDFKSQFNKLWSIFDPCNGRQLSTYNLVKEAYLKSNKPDFEFVVCADDIPRTDFQKPWFCFSTTKEQSLLNDYSTVVPDYSFDSLHLKGRYGFPGDGIDDYEGIVNEIKQAGEQQPLTNKIGWIGHAGVHTRQHLLDFGQKIENQSFCEFLGITWYEEANKKWPSNFMTMPDQVKRWRYILEIQGNGWTDRLKFFFFSKRVLFIVERPYWEFYFKHLEPWVHYVPVDGWLTNLKENYFKLLSNPDLEQQIKKNAYNFAINNLRKSDAVNYYSDLIQNTNWKAYQKKNLYIPLTKPTTGDSFIVTED